MFELGPEFPGRERPKLQDDENLFALKSKNRLNLETGFQWRSGPGRTKKHLSRSWSIIRTCSWMVQTNLSYPDHIIRHLQFKMIEMKWRWRTPDLHISLVLKSEYKWWIRTSVLLGFSRIDSRLFKVSSSEVQNHQNDTPWTCVINRQNSCFFHHIIFNMAISVNSYKYSFNSFDSHGSTYQNVVVKLGIYFVCFGASCWNRHICCSKLLIELLELIAVLELVESQ